MLEFVVSPEESNAQREALKIWFPFAVRLDVIAWMPGMKPGGRWIGRSISDSRIWKPIDVIYRTNDWPKTPDAMAYYSPWTYGSATLIGSYSFPVMSDLGDHLFRGSKIMRDCNF